MSILLSCLLLPLHLQTYFFQNEYRGVEMEISKACYEHLRHADVKMWELLIAFILPCFLSWEVLVWSTAQQQPPAHPSCCGEVSAAVHCCYTEWCWMAVGFCYSHCCVAKLYLCVSLALGQLKPHVHNELEVDFWSCTMAPVSNTYVTGLFSITEIPLLRGNNSAQQVFEGQDFNLY